MVKRVFIRVLPWFLIMGLLVVLGVREKGRSDRERQLTELEAIFDDIYRAPGAKEENAALRRLAQWARNEDVGYGFAIFDHRSGQHISSEHRVKELQEAGSPVAFRIRFNLEGHSPSRTTRVFYIVLREPSNIQEIMLE